MTEPRIPPAARNTARLAFFLLFLAAGGFCGAAAGFALWIFACVVDIGGGGWSALVADHVSAIGIPAALGLLAGGWLGAKSAKRLSGEDPSARVFSRVGVYLVVAAALIGLAFKVAASRNAAETSRSEAER